MASPRAPKGGRRSISRIPPYSIYSISQGGLEALEKEPPLTIKAFQYGITCNGFERLARHPQNHKPEAMVKAFEVAGARGTDFESVRSAKDPPRFRKADGFAGDMALQARALQATWLCRKIRSLACDPRALRGARARVPGWRLEKRARGRTLQGRILQALIFARADCCEGGLLEKRFLKVRLAMPGPVRRLLT